MAGRHLALFDFDGTITTSDTMFGFVWHAHGPVRAWLGLLCLSPILVAHRVGLVPADRAKVALLRWFFGGQNRAAMEAWAASFADAIDRVVRPAALERLAWHREQGHDVVVVSASLDVWVAPWAERHGLRLLCTSGRFDGDVFTGDLACPNCNGAEKEARIRAALDLDAYDSVYGYGDSEGDAEMLGLADEMWFKPFRTV
jgi:HAD superfamily hydrolase (TIGR01490 family)